MGLSPASEVAASTLRASSGGQLCAGALIKRVSASECRRSHPRGESGSVVIAESDEGRGARAGKSLGLILLAGALATGACCGKEQAPETPAADAPGNAPDQQPGRYPPGAKKPSPKPGDGVKTPGGSPLGVQGEKKQDRDDSTLPSSTPRRADKPAPKAGALRRPPSPVLPGLETLDQAQSEFARAQADLERVYQSGAGKAVALGAGDGRCKAACAAFSSLERSADAICRLAGESEARCKSARKIVAIHRGKVAACRCPSN